VPAVTEALTKDQLEELVAVLRSERTRLYARGGIDVDIDADGPDPMDLQDRAADEVQARDRGALSGHDRARLAEVEDALARVAQGNYGICEETGEPIPFARLRAEPTTRYTVEALELLEDEDARARVRGRPGDDDAY
jgi:DnaK suppressor protein